MAKFCFQQGIVRLSAWSGRASTDREQALKRIEVIEDEESDIVEAVQRLSANYDFIVTSGGIGPT